MAKLVDALVSGTSVGNNVQVRVLLRAPQTVKGCLNYFQVAFFVLIWFFLLSANFLLYCDIHARR